MIFMGMNLDLPEALARETRSYGPLLWREALFPFMAEDSTAQRFHFPFLSLSYNFFILYIYAIKKNQPQRRSESIWKD